MIGIISDIHGNYEALKAVLNELDRIKVKKIICLGDIAGYYCQINECCEALRERNIFSLMGNHDFYLTTGESCPRSNSANACLDYQRKVIKPENMEWLASLSFSSEKDALRIVHGGWNDPMDEYINPSREYFDSLNGSYFASGHTHVPCVWSGGGKTYCNPGSVGQPRDGNPKASFALWSGTGFELKRVDYNIEMIQKAMIEVGFSPYFFDNLSKGVQIGGGISSYG